MRFISILLIELLLSVAPGYCQEDVSLLIPNYFNCEELIFYLPSLDSINSYQLNQYKAKVSKRFQKFSNEWNHKDKHRKRFRKELNKYVNKYIPEAKFIQACNADFDEKVVGVFLPYIIDIDKSGDSFVSNWGIQFYGDGNEFKPLIFKKEYGWANMKSFFKYLKEKCQ